MTVAVSGATAATVRCPSGGCADDPAKISLTGIYLGQVGLFVTSPLYFAAGADIGTPSDATASFDHTSARGDLPSDSWTGDPVAASSYPYLPSAATWVQRSAAAFTIWC